MNSNNVSPSQDIEAENVTVEQVRTSDSEVRLIEAKHRGMLSYALIFMSFFLLSGGIALSLTSGCAVPWVSSIGVIGTLWGTAFGYYFGSRMSQS